MRRRFCSSAAQAVVSLTNERVTVGTPPRTLVDGLSLTIREGERWAILGVNGCGKSTLAKLLGSRLTGSEDGTTPPSIHLGATLPGSAVPYASISFESHTWLLQQEATEFRESRFESRHMRASAASYLHPDLYPPDPESDGRDVGFRPERTRLGTLPVRYDTPPDSPLLAELEAAATGGTAGALLRRFGLEPLRHSPLHGMSTGEGRKLMLIGELVPPLPRLLVLDEAFDGLDAASRDALREELRASYAPPAAPASALVIIAHRPPRLAPTHALLLGQGECGTGYVAGEWSEMEPIVSRFFETQHALPPPRRVKTAADRPKLVHSAVGGSVAMVAGSTAEPLVELRGVTVAYPTRLVFDRLSWTVRAGEKWVVAGPNGSGKSTLLELITGENMQAYQNDVWLFGKKKGAGVSVWDIKQRLGVISTKFHMDYADYCDPRHRRSSGGMSTWQVVLSGFFDSIGLYKQPDFEQEKIARRWVERFGLSDLVTPPVPGVRKIDRFSGKVYYERPTRGGKPCPDFSHLSFGQQKLVLLCRAMVKAPSLLLLDEPTHGLQGDMRFRLLEMIGGLADDPDVTVVYISHHQDEVDALGFVDVLQL